ncbi:hypothetical protein PSHT_12515 [Puccinia striiformis]|uniref:DUF6589 domain-containing protein n=1 Tax=Puccinia striiformis TaxID=27350 RepID=A0A2S4UW12_9BASI|nr:hypothetical protein PSHT_12515 [Puccinia striiformis]
MCIQNTPKISDISEKILYIGKVIQTFGLDPKRFITAFLQSTHEQIVLNRHLWGAPIGWPSTFKVLDSIKTVVRKTTEGKSRWKAYILSEAKEILAAEGGAHGQFPAGNYYNSSKITPGFFDEEAKSERVVKLITEDMPFLYELLKDKLTRKATANHVDFGDSDSGNESNESEASQEPTPAIPSRGSTPVDPEERTTRNADEDAPFHHKKIPQDLEPVNEIYDRADRPHVISATICAVVAFGANRRDNALQIQNSVVLLACGVTERVSTFLNYIGLSSSRRTAHRAIQALGRIASKKITQIMSPNSKSPLAPIICIDNIDFEEAVHEKSVEKSSQMFHGTWGYVHVVDRQLLKKFDPSDFSLEKYKESILNSATMPLKPSVFLPTQKTSYHFQAVIKSQITDVLLKYIATAGDNMVNLRKNPPVIEPIEVKRPNITMLKLMIASDNSAQGMGEVFEGIMHQTGLTPAEFFSPLRVFEGDLGTCMNLESLRNQRKPSGHIENSLSSIFTLLGASHILWNVAQAVYLLHYGNYLDSNDLGAWHTLHALGVPAEKPTTKKDFTLMLTNLTKSHEASILYCLLTVMGYPNALLSDEKVTLPSGKLQEVVDGCYQRFFSPDAFNALLDDESDNSASSEDSVSSKQTDGSDSASSSDSSEAPKKKKDDNPPVPGLKNFLLRLRDFASIVECDRAMRAGDIGRVINMWIRCGFSGSP